MLTPEREVRENADLQNQIADLEKALFAARKQAADQYRVGFNDGRITAAVYLEAWGREKRDARKTAETDLHGLILQGQEADAFALAKALRKLQPGASS